MVTNAEVFFYMVVKLTLMQIYQQQKCLLLKCGTTGKFSNWVGQEGSKMKMYVKFKGKASSKITNSTDNNVLGICVKERWLSKNNMRRKY